MLSELPKNINTNDFVFVCSNDFKSKKIKHKGFKIYYEKRLKEDTIYFMPNPYFDKDTQEI